MDDFEEVSVNWRLRTFLSDRLGKASFYWSCVQYLNVTRNATNSHMKGRVCSQKIKLQRFGWDCDWMANIYCSFKEGVRVWTVYSVVLCMAGAMIKSQQRRLV